MKSSPLPTILLLVLVLSELTALWLCWANITRTRELAALQNEVNQIELKRRIASSLAVDALEYSKTHPEIDPILMSAGLKPGAIAGTNKPSTK